MKAFPLTGMALATLMLLTACGGGNSSSTPSSSSGSAETTSTASATTAGSDTVSTAQAVSRGAYSSAPVVTAQPVSVVVAAGAPATLSVTAVGAATLTYQWRKDGTAISGATAATYSVAAAAASDAGSYDVVVTNAKGSATSSAATLTVTNTSTGTLSADVLASAQSFMATLSSNQLATLQTAWSLDAARRWSNLPASMVSRNGLSWGSLSTAQKTAARTLIATALGSTGNALHLSTQMADNYLYSIGGGSGYGEGQYAIAFVGTPSATGLWMLQLTGHHLTFNVSFNGSVKSATPLFMGIEPKASFTYGGTTYDPMLAQRTAVAALGSALTAYPAAKLAGSYGDVLFGANGSGNIDNTCPRDYASVTEHGLPYASLSSTDQALVQAAIRSYVDTQATEYADDLLSAYLSSTALAGTYVAYTGTGTVSTNGNYFRIEGPRVWIEFSVQRGVIISSDIHYHTIWRDKTGDYGGQCPA